MGKKNSAGARIELNLHLMAILQGLFFTMLLIILISLVLALLVYFASWQSTSRVLNLLTHVSVVGGATWAGRRCAQKSWLHGLLVGFFAFFIFTWMGGNQTLVLTWLWFKRLLRMVFVAMLGGILGGLIKPE